MLHLLRRQRSAEVISDNEARRIAVGENNQATLRSQQAQQRQLLPIFEDTEAVGLNNQRVYRRRQPNFIVFSFDDNRFPHPDHIRRPVFANTINRAAVSSSSVRGAIRVDFSRRSASASTSRLSRSAATDKRAPSRAAFFNANSRPR